MNVDPALLGEEVARVGPPLVESGDTLELVARLGAVASSPHTIGVESEEPVQ